MRTIPTQKPESQQRRPNFLPPSPDIGGCHSNLPRVFLFKLFRSSEADIPPLMSTRFFSPFSLAQRLWPFHFGEVAVCNETSSSIRDHCAASTDWHQESLPTEGHEGTRALFFFSLEPPQILTIVTDATANGHPRREDDVALLARFVRRTLDVISRI